MEIYKTLDLLERVEHEISDLYKQLHVQYRLNKEAADFFLEMHMDEEAHVQMIRMERRIVQAAPKAFSDVQINLSEISSLLDNIMSLKSRKLELPELIGRIYSIENNPAEKYLVEALKDANEDLSDFLMRLSSSFSAHADKVAVFARALGVQIENIQDRYSRKARVSFNDKVLMNQSLSVRGVDISEGGLFLLTNRTFRVGEALSMQFSVLKSLITADAAVQFVIPEVGMGVMFTSLRDSDEELIKQYVDRQIAEEGIKKQVSMLLVGSSLLPGRDMRTYMHHLLSAGYKVVDLSGFEEAAHFLKIGANLSCIVLSMESEADVNYFLLDFISIMERYKNVPVLIMTNNQKKDFRDHLIRKGVNKILVRMSTSPKQLADEINNIVQ